VTAYRVRFQGPAALAVRVATELADTDGVELISSDQPVVLDESMVALNVTVEGAFDAVADAVAGIRGGMPTGVSIEIAGGP
jgi:CTP:molybdopterin cytidylyltransferase MocA